MPSTNDSKNMFSKFGWLQTLHSKDNETAWKNSQDEIRSIHY